MTTRTLSESFTARNSTEFFMSLAARSWRLGEHGKERDHVTKWTACCGAYQVVGTRNGGTRKLAERIKVYKPRTQTWEPASVDLVEQMARAYDTFLYLWTWDRAKAWDARRTFTWTRFNLLSEAIREYEFSPSDAYDFLFQKNYEGQYLSGKAMLAFIADVCDERPEWQRRLTPFAAYCDKFLTDYEDAPAGLLTKIREVRDETKKYMEAQ